MNKEIDYIASHYKEGRFSVTKGWKRMGIAATGGWHRYKAAAAIAAVVILTATATVIYREYQADEIPQSTVPVVVNPLAEVKVIDFENAPLKDVVEKIESVYSVKVENVPADSEKYSLSLHYEGTPTDLISVINDILGTQMTVSEK